MKKLVGVSLSLSNRTFSDRKPISFLYFFFFQINQKKKTLARHNQKRQHTTGQRSLDSYSMSQKEGNNRSKYQSIGSYHFFWSPKWHDNWTLFILVSIAHYPVSLVIVCNNISISKLATRRPLNFDRYISQSFVKVLLYNYHIIIIIHPSIVIVQNKVIKER